MAFLRLKLYWQILIALVLAVVAGLLTGTQAGLFGVSFYSVFDLGGKLFLNALRMLIVPLIVSSIIVGIAGIGGSQNLGRLGVKTILYYVSTSLLAILVGLIVVNAVAPGIVDGQPAKDLIGFTADVSTFEDKVAGKGTSDVVEIFLRMVPTNVVAAAAYNFWQGMFEVMIKITDLIMRFAPLGVFALVAKVVAGTGFDAFAPLASFFFSVAAALAIHFVITLPLLLYFVGGVSPIRHFKAMSSALLTAFSTASSSATLPITMECVEKNAGVSNRTTSFVLPLGATVNMDGTALYECVAAMFIAQAYGLELSFATQFTVVLVALLTSIGVAGIPAASLVAISIILTAIGLPVEGIGPILAVDRVLDMMRTATNVWSDSAGAVIIGTLQGEEGILEEKNRRG
jgi:proton glutamate symport protein